MTQHERDRIHAVAFGYLLGVATFLLGLAAMIVWEIIR
jgi:hypothetical protein